MDTQIGMIIESFVKVDAVDGRFQCPYNMCSKTFQHKRSVYPHYKQDHLGIQIQSRVIWMQTDDRNYTQKCTGIISVNRGGSLLEILNYLPDGGHFSRVPM